MTTIGIGVYGNQPRDEILEMLGELQGNMVLLADGGLDLSGEIRRRWPNTAQIGRITYPNEKQAEFIAMATDARKGAAVGAALVWGVFGRADVDIFMGLCEAVNKDSTPAQLQSFVWIELGMVAAAHARGKKALVGNLPPGNFLAGAGDLSALDELARKGDYFGYHAYTERGWGAMEPGHLWHENRWMLHRADWQKRDISPTFILSEALHEPGWKGWLTEEMMIADWVAFADWVNLAGTVAAVIGYQAGHPSERWNDYRLTLAWSKRMGIWNRAHGTPVVPVTPQTGGGMPKPIYLAICPSNQDRNEGRDSNGTPLQPPGFGVYNEAGGMAYLAKELAAVAWVNSINAVFMSSPGESTDKPAGSLSNLRQQTANAKQWFDAAAPADAIKCIVSLHTDSGITPHTYGIHGRGAREATSRRLAIEIAERVGKVFNHAAPQGVFSQMGTKDFNEYIFWTNTAPYDSVLIELCSHQSAIDLATLYQKPVEVASAIVEGVKAWAGQSTPVVAEPPPDTVVGELRETLRVRTAERDSALAKIAAAKAALS